MKLNPAHIAIPLPWVPQRTDYDCGVAIAESVLAYAGRPYGDRTLLIRALGTHPLHGTEAEEIAEVMRAAKLKADIHSDLDKDDLMEFVEQRAIVLAAIQAWGGGHWVGVVGHCSQWVYFRDPLLEPEQFGRRGWRDWMRMWRDKNRRDMPMFGLAVVVRAKQRKAWTVRSM